MKNFKELETRFEAAYDLLKSKPDGRVYSRRKVKGLVSGTIIKGDGEYYRVILLAGLDYQGNGSVVFWFYPGGDIGLPGDVENEKKINFETGMKLVDLSIDCDDIIKRFQEFVDGDRIVKDAVPLRIGFSPT